VGHVSEEMKSLMPRSPDAEGMEESNQDGRVRPGRSLPGNHVRGDREDSHGEGSGRPGSGRNDEGKVRMQELSHTWRPLPTRLQECARRAWIQENRVMPVEMRWDHAERGAPCATRKAAAKMK
jgi:hypothetical protein